MSAVMRKPLFSLLEAGPSGWWVVITAFSMVVIALLDWVTGSALGFSLFYLLPIGLGIFRVEPRWGYVYAFLCSGLWFANVLVSGRKFDSALVLAWTIAMRLANYSLFAFVLIRLRERINDSRRQVRSLEAANQEKALLLRELNHRVKNSLTSVAGLIDLESGNVGDPRLEEALGRLQDRVQSIAELYDLLFHSADMRSVSLSEYFQRIAAYIESSFAAGSRGILVKTDLADIRIDSKRAISLGIVANELLTDAFKYAFPGGRRGTISIALRRSDDRAMLEISDDGVGLPPGFSASAFSGFGLKLVTALARDLGATLVFEVGPGARISLDLPLGPEAGDDP
jgi:two-component sensor histidine kinase